MEIPVIAAKNPIMMEMEPGDYLWCACGKSSDQPFCDNSHRGTGILPVRVKIEEKKTVWWCRCKHSGNKPFCDNSHRTL